MTIVVKKRLRMHGGSMFYFHARDTVVRRAVPGIQVARRTQIHKTEASIEFKYLHCLEVPFP